MRTGYFQRSGVATFLALQLGLGQGLALCVSEHGHVVLEPEHGRALCQAHVECEEEGQMSREGKVKSVPETCSDIPIAAGFRGSFKIPSSSGLNALAPPGQSPIRSLSPISEHSVAGARELSGSRSPPHYDSTPIRRYTESVRLNI